MYERWFFKLYMYQIIWPHCFYFLITLHHVQISGKQKRKVKTSRASWNHLYSVVSWIIPSFCFVTNGQNISLYFAIKASMRID